MPVVYWLEMKLTPRQRRSVPAIVALVFVLIGTVQIVRTYAVFSNTYDEPAHLATGMEWLDLQRYDYERLHPPLARIAAAVGPFLGGVRSTGSPDMWNEGRALLYGDGGYGRNLTLARLGILPFFVVALMIVWFWTKRVLGAPEAAIAVALCSSLPPVLAHAGLATTDMPATAMLALACYAFTRLLDAQTGWWSVWFGLAVGLAFITKFSTIVFLPAGLMAMLVVHLVTQGRPRPIPWRRIARVVGVAGAAAFVVVWAVYRFSFGVNSWGFTAPAPEWFDGIWQLSQQNAGGREGYIFSEVSTEGHWYFFPVALAVKTPLPFLFLAAGGLAMSVRSTTMRPALAAGAAAVAMLLASMTSKFNLGVRHVLPLYPLLAIGAAGVTTALWRSPARRRVGRVLVVALLGWQAVGVWRAHPDYLAWFNAIAGPRPENMLVDSNLDWGQDLLRLADTVRARGIDSLALEYFGSAVPSQHIANVRQLRRYELPDDWFAASVSAIKGLLVYRNHGYQWMELIEPDIRIGKSIRMFRLDPGERAMLDSLFGQAAEDQSR